jgi:phosphoribosylamine--glycine ligase
MKVLIVGSGGREHALAWKVAQSARVETVYVAPGNAGTAHEAGVSNIPIAAEDTDALIRFATEHHIDLTIIGPEGPLVSGIVDAFTAAGLPCFGPRKNSAVLEASKSFTKDFLSRHKIPTAAYAVFTDLDKAIAYINQHDIPVVIKADGLAAGKGVVVATTRQQALDAVTDMLQANKFGDAGHRVVVEDFLTGEEASFIVMVDGVNILPMATSQDHKARDRGDQGPNTGGMGAYSPAPVITADLHDRIMAEVIRPTVDGMKMEGRTYTGFLYAGLMISPDGKIRVLEYNCRFGDPETQPIMMRLQSDLSELCLLALAGKLDQATVIWDKRSALGIVAAAGGYPDTPRKGDIISGLDSQFGADVKVFHAGTTIRDNKVITAGGRVLCITALGETVTQAQQAALTAIRKIAWDGMFYRDDIGYRAIARELQQKG